MTLLELKENLALLLHYFIRIFELRLQIRLRISVVAGIFPTLTATTSRFLLRAPRFAELLLLSLVLSGGGV